MTRCDLCGKTGAHPAGDEATILDEHGGAGVALCKSCTAKLREPRCAVCGTRCTEKYTLAFIPETGHDPDDYTEPICKECRAAAIFGDGRVVE